MSLSALIRNIASGQYRADDKLPSEATLGDQFGVSRMTVRGALAELQRRGLIEKRNGAGSFLTRRALRTGSRGQSPPRLFGLTNLPRTVEQNRKPILIFLPSKILRINRPRNILEPTVFELFHGNIVSHSRTNGNGELKKMSQFHGRYMKIMSQLQPNGYTFLSTRGLSPPNQGVIWNF